MGMETHSDEILKGMLESCIKGNNFVMKEEIKKILDLRDVPYDEPDLVFGWLSSSG